MGFGFSLPARGPLANRHCLQAMAERGEALGFTHLAVPDHIVVPLDIESKYPYSSTGAFPGQESGDCLEQLAVMAFLAGITSRAMLLTSVMVVPHRGAVLSAKSFATIDQLSNGRVIAGCGVGWLEEEFVAIGAPPFPARGRVTDEYLEAFKILWTAREPRYAGEFVAFDNVSFLPQPVQKPHPPIWIGGESGPALRRTAKYGDAWFPIGANPRHPLNTTARLEKATTRLRQLTEEAGREPRDVTLTYWANWPHDTGEVKLESGERHLFTGTSAQIVEDVQALQAMGFEHLLFNFQRGELDRSLDSMQAFVDDVLTQIG